jgi:hypothetical protein
MAAATAATACDAVVLVEAALFRNLYCAARAREFTSFAPRATTRRRE